MEIYDEYEEKYLGEEYFETVYEPSLHTASRCEGEAELYVPFHMETV